MRVKKLNANRRPKAGEDDVGGDTEQQGVTTANWTSPTKGYHLPQHQRVHEIDVGANSPTDSSATLSVAPPVELDLSTTPATMPTVMTKPTSTNTASDAADEELRSQSPSWRDCVSRSVRESVHEKIVEYLKALKPNAPPKVLEKLPGLAYRMEEALFKLASSEQDYCDQTSLPQRLTLIQQANAKRLLQQQSPAVSPKDKDAPRTVATPVNTSNAQPTTVSSPSSVSRKPLNEEQARVVFSCLQSWRQKLVNMYGATPWEILPNQILAKVAVFIPSNQQELVICGMSNEQLERFGNSLLQEIQKIVNALNTNGGTAGPPGLQVNTSLPPRSSSPSGLKRPSPGSGKAASGRKSDGAKRGATSEQSGGGGGKKRKTTTSGTEAAPVVAPAPVPLNPALRLPTNFITPPPFMSPAQLLMRPMDAAAAAVAAASTSNVSASSTPSLPALLPSGPLPTTVLSNSNGVKKLSPYAIQPQSQQSPFFNRLPTVPGSVNNEQENRIHLLAQGAGQVSKQQDTQQQQDVNKSIELYIKEVQTLRWMLQESQREKSQLEAEVQRLRQQLRQTTAGP